MKTLPSLSIFFPTYNDALAIPALVEKVQEGAQSITNTYEIIIINDGSSDDTVAVVTNLQRKFKYLRFITHATNRGYGGALISGFKEARYEWIFYTDGDGQYDPHELTSLVYRASQKIDVVNGYKQNRSDPWYRIILGSFYNAGIQRIFHPPIRDIDCDFRLIRKKLLNNIILQSRSGAICLELILKLKKNGARFAQVPVSHYPRRFGQSQFFSIPRIVQTLRDLSTIIPRS